MNRKTPIHSLRLFTVLVLACGMVASSVQLYAQQTSPSSQYPTQQPRQGSEQQPKQTPDQSGQQSPDAQAQSEPGVQTFTGVIVKSGDKYVLQDSDSGNTYDVDRQDQVKQFEGKKVRIHGTLDASSKMIHIQ